MGERDLSAVATASPQSRHWIVPVVLLVFLVLLVVARPVSVPATPVSIAHYLYAASLGTDLDGLFGDEDLARLRQLPQGDALSVRLARSETDRLSFPGGGVESLVLAPFVRIGGLRGAVFGTALVLVLALTLAARTMRHRLQSPWSLLLIFLFGSIAIRYVLEPRPEAMLLAALVAAFSLAYRGEVRDFVEMPEVYDRAFRESGMRFAVRWGLVGFLIAVVAIHHPLYLLLFIPAGIAAPESARRGAWIWIGVGAGACLGLSVLLAGGPTSLPWLSDTAVFEGRAALAGDWSAGSRMPSPLDSLVVRASPPLWLWNLAFLTGGQTVGLIPYCLPLVLILALWEPRSGRSTLVATAAVMLVVAAALWPFDYAGESAVLGNALLLPLFGALWLVPTRPLGRGWWIVSMLIAGVFLYPVWLEVIGLQPQSGVEGDRVSPVAMRYLPLESTQRVPQNELVRSGTLHARLLGGGVSGKDGRLGLRGGSWGDLLLASPRPLSAVRLEFDGQAGSDLEVEGAELGDTLFSSDGRIVFEILLGETSRRHPVWWSSADHSLYDLHLRLPKAPPFQVLFTLTPIAAAAP